MSLHPAIVHIPIGLLLTYSAIEVLTINAKRKKWMFAKTLLLSVGVLGTFAAIISGLIAAGDSQDPILALHKAFALTTTGLYAVLAAAYLTRDKNSPRRFAVVKNFVMKTPVRVTLAILGGTLLTLTGSLGSLMTHGPSNFITEFVYDVLLAADIL